ncbi:MAG: RNA polymerase sigma factor [Myxococcales bacterium]|nr:RNA polymerase sigma factor [Myxococcales bacterium]
MARRAGDGDARAQAWLARRLIPRVRRIARALTTTAAEADDAAQLSLMAILRSAGGYRGDASLEAWAKRVAVRTTLRYVRRERARRPAVSLEELGEPASRGGDAPQRQAELSRDVRVMLESVSEVQRTALVLHHALGYSIEEIAELTGASTNTVKSRLRLGTRTLRKRVRRERSIGAGGARGDA